MDDSSRQVDRSYEELLSTIRSHHPEQGGEFREASAALGVKLIQDQMAAAREISAASEATARGLVRATNLLAAFTLVLAAATVVLVIVTWRGGGGGG